MKPNDQNQINLLNPQLCGTQESLNHETSESQSQINPEELRLKALDLLSLAKNSPERERDFRKTCLLNQKNSYLSPELNEAYQEYIKSYHKITSLYLIDLIGGNYDDNDENSESANSNDINGVYNLYTYNTEIEKEEVKALDISAKYCKRAGLIQLPNGELFFYGEKNDYSGTAFVIGNDYRVRMLPTGLPYRSTLAIYYNRYVYCFGGYNKDFSGHQLSTKFDLDKNQWIKLAPFPKNDWLHCCLIFHENILIPSYYGKTLWLYAIDIDSYSTVPYEFEALKRKIAVNAEDRLYIIEFWGWIYESEVGDEYNWKRISKSEINFLSEMMCWAYNKGGIYIGYIYNDETRSYPRTIYYKFNLDEKVLVKLSNSL